MFDGLWWNLKLWLRLKSSYLWGWRLHGCLWWNSYGSYGEMPFQEPRDRARLLAGAEDRRGAVVVNRWTFFQRRLAKKEIPGISQVMFMDYDIWWYILMLLIYLKYYYDIIVILMILLLYLFYLMLFDDIWWYSMMIPNVFGSIIVWSHIYNHQAIGVVNICEPLVSNMFNFQATYIRGWS